MGGWLAEFVGGQVIKRGGGIGTHDLVKRRSFRELLAPLILLSGVEG